LISDTGIYCSFEYGIVGLERIRAFFPEITFVIGDGGDIATDTITGFCDEERANFTLVFSLEGL
jgi:hypothetical protein